MSAYETMWRVDGNGKPISVKRTETIQVSTVHFNVVLDEIPHAFYGVEIEDQEGNTYHVVESEDNIVGQGCYVDYNNGIITFAPEHGGKIMTFTYNGRGYKKVYSSRIAYDTKSNRDAQALAEFENLKRQIMLLNSLVEKQQMQIDFLIDELEKFID